MGDVADIVVVGAGHNGLVCAAYLARAGLDVIVLEQGDRAGGALWPTEWQGHQLERGAVEHTAILTSGVVEELELAEHGLRYECRTAAATHLFGGDRRIVIGATVAETAESIGALSASDARAWRELAARSEHLPRALALASEGWIPPPALARGFARTVAGRGAGELIAMTRMSVLELATRWFDTPELRALAMFRAVFSGLAPWSPGSAAAFLLTTSGHGRRFGRPVGGSRALVDALDGAVRRAGGLVFCRSRVDAIARHNSSWRVSTDGGEVVTARRAVVSAMAPRPFLLDVLDGAPARVIRRARAVREVVDNMSQLTLTAAIDDDTCLPSLGDDELDRGAMWLLPEPGAALDAYTAARVGRLPASPATLVTFPSVADPGAAPRGRATMWANSFAARHLHRRPWVEARGDAVDAVWRSIDACLPGIRGHVDHELLTTPDDLTAMNGADNAGSHVAPIPSQTLGWRPAPGLGNYRTPIDGIFLTGAGTHPGGGVSGLPGRACAMAVLDALGPGRRRRARRVTRQIVDAFGAARAVGRQERRRG